MRSIREAKGLTLMQVGAMTNKEKQTIQRIEKGETNPTLYFLFQLSSGLGMELQELVNFRVPKNLNRK